MEQKLIIEGMSCAACSSSIERILNKKESVKASVNLTTKILTVSYDEDLITLEDIKHLIIKAGFEPKDMESTVTIPIEGMT